MTGDEVLQARNPTTGELFARLRNGDETARRDLLERHRGLVFRLAADYRHKTSLSLQELVAEGDLGLLIAISKFDPVKASAGGVKFSSYAYWWIKRNIIRALIKHQSLISVPEHISELLRQYRENEAKLIQLMGRLPTDEELAAVLGLSREQLKHVQRRHKMSEVSLDEPVSRHESGSPLIDLVGKDPDLEGQFIRKDQVKHFLRCLSPLEKKVLTLRFGLGGTPELTYREIAERLKSAKPAKQISRQRVCQIVWAALKKIRRLAEEESGAQRKP